MYKAAGQEAAAEMPSAMPGRVVGLGPRDMGFPLRQRAAANLAAELAKTRCSQRTFTPSHSTLPQPLKINVQPEREIHLQQW